MKTILEYLVNNHISTKTFFDTISDGDYFVIDYNKYHGAYDYTQPKIIGKFKKNNDKYPPYKFTTYFQINMGDNNISKVYANSSATLQNVNDLRYPTDDELDILKYVEKNSNINTTKDNYLLGKYNYESNIFHKRI